jgi:hypothetical protein
MTLDWEPSDRFDEWQGCIGCARYRRGRCEAYPVRIPINILSGEVDHMVPRSGQVVDLVFEPMDVERWRATGERRPAGVTSAPGGAAGPDRR